MRGDRMTKQARTAEDLWALLDPRSTIEEIIARRAWLPLGFKTFTEAWLARGFDRVTPPVEARALIVYQMLDDATDPLDIACAIRGVGPEIITSLVRQKANGVPAHHASVRRRPIR